MFEGDSDGQRDQSRNSLGVRTWLEEQKFSQASCKSLPFTAMFYVSFLVAQLAHRDVPTVYPLLSSVRSSLVTGVVPTPTDTKVSRPSPTALTDVMSWGDALVWMDSTLVPFLWVDRDGGPGVAMGVNQVIGGARVQQWRLEEVDCDGAEGLKDVYGNFLRDRYNRTCRSTNSAYGRANIAGSKPANAPANATLQGDQATFEAAYTYWLDADLSSSQALEHIQGFRDNGWLSTATEKLSVQFAMYCGQVGWFTLVEAQVVMDRVGAFRVSVSPKALQTQVYRSLTTVLADLWFCANLAWLFSGEVWGLVSAYKRKGVKGHLMQFYRVLNWSLIVGGCGVVTFFVWLFLELEKTGEELSELLGAHPNLEGAALKAHYLRLNDAYDNLSYMAETVRTNEFVAFWYSMMMLLKFFQNFQANERLAVITKTLSMASEDLLHFLLIFLLVFFNFVMGAYFLFGQALKEWSSYGFAFNTGFRALMGDFDFNSMYLIAPISATIWFWVYMLFIFLLMINMLLAIVMEAYANVKTEAGRSESLLELVIRKVTVWRAKMKGEVADEDEIIRSSQLSRIQMMTPEPTLTDLNSKIVFVERGLRKLLEHHDLAVSRRGTESTSLDALRAAGAEDGTRSAPPRLLEALAAPRGAPLSPVADVEAQVEEDAGGGAELASACACGNAFADGSGFCGRCGRMRPRRQADWAEECTDCQATYSQQDRFCRFCGSMRQKHAVWAADTDIPGSRRQRQSSPPAGSREPPDLPGLVDSRAHTRAASLSTHLTSRGNSKDEATEKLASLREVMDMYGVAFNPAQAEKLLAAQQRA